MRPKLLVVDDDKEILSLLTDYLEMNDYIVFAAENGMQALEKVAKGPDLILLDIGMPDMDGLEVCERIREHVSCPILFLTAKVEEPDKINAFRKGGDDYIEKPFRIRELGARIEAHLRRERRNSTKQRALFEGGIVIDYDSKKAFVHEEPIPLSKKEYEIIELLAMNAGQVFDRERIYERVWGREKEGDSGVIMEHIRKIRKKFAEHTDYPFIETVWGVGYQWNA
ncbi:response regulator transcription factor [Cohnella sp. AR92]|uniref:response regulator transcription factor n=1 Tax=Cohnella sp. AR92 TaxID=648716 RepID=UPI000F8E813C|nr:response regulator transcription factor [Cohnella sp. AR92]RUS49216.1 response regulator transcription factor [Cohnella sp. AR92]